MTPDDIVDLILKRFDEATKNCKEWFENEDPTSYADFEPLEAEGDQAT